VVLPPCKVAGGKQEGDKVREGEDGKCGQQGKRRDDRRMGQKKKGKVAWKRRGFLSDWEGGRKPCNMDLGGQMRNVNRPNGTRKAQKIFRGKTRGENYKKKKRLQSQRGGKAVGGPLVSPNDRKKRKNQFLINKWGRGEGNRRDRRKTKPLKKAKS